MFNRPPQDEDERNARERGRLGEERAEQRQDLDVEWREGGRVDYLIDILAATRREFTADDIWAVLDNNIEEGLLEPVENRRVLGPILSRAVRRGSIAKTNRVIPSTRRNASPIPVWRTSDPHWNNGRSEMQRRRITEAVRTQLDEVIASKRRLLLEADEEKQRLQRELRDDEISRRQYDRDIYDMQPDKELRQLLEMNLNNNQQGNLSLGKMMVDGSEWEVEVVHSTDWNIVSEPQQLGRFRTSGGVMVLFREIKRDGTQGQEGASLFIDLPGEGLEQHKVELIDDSGNPMIDEFVKGGLADKIASLSKNIITKNETVKNWLEDSKGFFAPESVIDPITLQVDDQNTNMFDEEKLQAIMASRTIPELEALRNQFSDWEGGEEFVNRIYSDPELLRWALDYPGLLQNIIQNELQSALSDFAQEVAEFDWDVMDSDFEQDDGFKLIEDAVDEGDLDRIRELGFATGYYEDNIIRDTVQTIEQEIIRNKRAKARRANLGLRRKRSDPTRRNIWKDRMLSQPLITTRESGRRVYRRRISNQDFQLRKYAQNKSQAKALAQIVRKTGFNARVIPVRNGHGVYVGGRRN